VTADAWLATPGVVLLMSTALRSLVVTSAVALGLVCQFLVQHITMKVINMEIVTEIAASLMFACGHSFDARALATAAAR
jgi:hypothetical protein